MRREEPGPLYDRTRDPTGTADASIPPVGGNGGLSRRRPVGGLAAAPAGLASMAAPPRPTAAAARRGSSLVPGAVQVTGVSRTPPALPRVVDVAPDALAVKETDAAPPIGEVELVLSEDGSRLFYAPLASRTLYGVATEALVSEVPGEDAAAVENFGERPSASDGLEHDAEGRLYLTAYEQNAILRRLPDATYETVVRDPRVLWPDTMALADDGYLYFTANQLHRQPRYQNGLDLRRRPYPLFRVAVDGTPVRLG